MLNLIVNPEITNLPFTYNKLLLYHRIKHERGDTQMNKDDTSVMKPTEVDEDDGLDRVASFIVRQVIQKAMTLESRWVS